MNYTKEELMQYYYLPINEAANKLGICATKLKKNCRDVGINRWPHRKYQAIINASIVEEDKRYYINELRKNSSMSVKFLKKYYVEKSNDIDEDEVEEIAEILLQMKHS